jgi:hypothetical protein
MFGRPLAARGLGMLPRMDGWGVVAPMRVLHTETHLARDQKVR